MNSKYQYKLQYLSSTFYEDYNSNCYPEIENKNNRPYIVILIKIKNNTFAIPFRTNISHNNCYKFKTSSRKTCKITGIDYTKAIIVNNKKYLGAPATIDNKEYVELSNNYIFIINQFKKYVNDYIHYCHSNNYYKKRKFQYTTLKYFHKELGICK